MPIIPEESVLDEFVNWDNTDPPMSSGNMAMPSGTNLDLQPVQDNLDFDLALANIDGDDFSFWALEHFETSNFDPGQVQAQTANGSATDVAALELCRFQHAPCDACQASGFTCKRIEEGQYKGYCTTCVALRHDCSFGLASPPDVTAPRPFPSNSWPIIGDGSTILHETPLQENTHSHSSPDITSSAAGAESGRDNSPRAPAVPKIGARFSRESVRILKAWLSTHSNRPYPSEEEREALQRQTGLNKTQIGNWLANARRRSKGKYQPTRSTSPSVRGFSGAIEIPPRRGTPALEHMNPLQRWENSPPENEPASVTAIASALLNNYTSSNGSERNSPYSLNFTDDDADRSCKGSSASSFGLINDERTLPLPYQASQRPAESPRSAYELIKLELAYYLHNIQDAARLAPSEDEIQHEACRIIYASEASSRSGLASRPSWLRDLLMSSDTIKRRARLSPIRGVQENCLGQLKINGKDNIFDDCPLEQQLIDFVKARALLGLTVLDYEIQVEACNIISRMEESSILPSEEVANLVLHLIYKDQTWLSSFRRRAGLPDSPGSMGLEGKNSDNSTVHNYSNLELELVDFTRNQRAMGIEPTDDELRRHARCVVHKCQDKWGQTAADNLTWLNAFKQRHYQQQNEQSSLPTSNSPPTTLRPLNPGLTISSDLTISPFTGPGTHSLVHIGVPHSSGSAATRRPPLFLNGSGNYRQLVRELARYVASCLSPNNPAQHTPTDEEIRHQARWIQYDDGDPFNITVADNAEWLTRFKRSTGILPATDGPGLPGGIGIWTGLRSPWHGSGSSSGPGFASSSPALSQVPVAHPTAPGSGESSLDFGEFAMSGVQSTGTINSPSSVNSGAVFSNQDLADKLMQFAVAELASSGRMPPDEAIIARAKEISGMEIWQAETTEADDPVLLGRFKALVVHKVKAVLGGGQDDNSPRQQVNLISSPPPVSHTPERGMDAIDPGLLPDLPPGNMGTAKKTSISPLPADVQVAITEQTLDEILRNI
ncbi:hypothetical protein VMCG_02273 [Cytospora schulzeri]|uniref:Homeobox domain-containing protein n=1 Tax=Cytospora schulzeri TaxID=448051 RepID=A0A423X1P4_9PEZI|nr:hypothetical protein VMCG_02273 [Valsa malicola]